MNTSTKNQLNRNQNPPQANAEVARPKAKTIKLGIDVHLDHYVAVRLIDGGTPQPPQRFEPPEFMLWVAKQVILADKVLTCYEAGPFGYSLHRKLEKMGVTNYVPRRARPVAPQRHGGAQWRGGRAVGIFHTSAQRR